MIKSLIPSAKSVIARPQNTKSHTYSTRKHPFMSTKTVISVNHKVSELGNLSDIMHAHSRTRTSQPKSIDTNCRLQIITANHNEQDYNRLHEPTSSQKHKLNCSQYSPFTN